MGKVDIDALCPDLVEAALNTALVETVDDVARDIDLHDTHDDSWVVGRHCRSKVEGILNVELNEESRDWIEAVTYQNMKDAGKYTSPKARKMLLHEFYTGTLGAMDSSRWQEINEMLWKYGYFENVDINDVLNERDWGKYSNGSVKCHGLTIGWNTGLVNGWGRLGIDSEWNKVSDATILLYWPGVDDMGKRRWKILRDMLDRLLDPASKDHKRFVKNWDKCHGDFSVDMQPVYGKDS